MLRHLPRVAMPALIALGACSTAPAPLTSEDFAPADLPPTAQADYNPTGHLQFLLGGQSLDKDDWEPVDSPFVFGMTFAYEDLHEVLGFEAGLNIGYDSADVAGIDVSVSITELFVGARKTFLPESIVHPFLGAGLTLMVVSTEGTAGFFTVSDDDACPALYAHGGVMFEITERFCLGLDGRIVRGSDVTLFDVDTDVDYEQLGIFAEFWF